MDTAPMMPSPAGASEDSGEADGSARRPLLRDVEPADLPILFAHQCDPEGARLAAFVPRDHAAFMTHWERLLADPACLAKAVVVDGATVGHLGLFGPATHREVGYWIAREHWGRGIATAALRRLLQEIAERPLYATVAEHNLGSRRVLERCGFARVGVELDFGGAAGADVVGLVYRLGDGVPAPAEDAG